MKSPVKQWWGGEQGTTAVEFALVGLPFIFLTIGIIEMAVMFTAQSLLHESVFTASRLIRTGQLQIAGNGEQTFRDAVCDFSALLIPCNKIQFQVKEVPSFADAENMPPKFDSNGNLLGQGFDPGAENDVVLVRVAYNYPIITPLMQPLLSNNGTTRTMFSTIVLQTEPYETN